MHFDATEFTRLAQDLENAAGTILDKIDPVVEKQALRSKEGMRFDMLESRSFNPVADVINYDIDRFTNHTRAEIGPLSAGRQVGDLAHFAYFGGARGGGGTVRDPEYWLTSEAESLEEHVGRVLDELL